MTKPTDSTMNCERFADALGDLLERDVDEATRSRLEAHAASCAECGPLLADLRTLRVDAANLPVLAPSRDLWSGIAKRIETPVVEIAPGGAVERWNDGTVERPKTERHWISPRWAGLAAAGIVAVTAVITHQVTKSTINVASPAQTVAAVPSAVPTAAAPAVAPTRDTTGTIDTSSVQTLQRPSVLPVSIRPSAESVYDREITRLRVIIAARRSTLDTATVGVIERNLKIIDEAIAQCRDALQRDPASRYLIESLNDALDTKVQLLRTAAMLPARS
jgi:hypothetical protein